MTTHKIIYKTESGQSKEIKVPRMAGQIKELILSKTKEEKHFPSNYNGYGYSDHEYVYVMDRKNALLIKKLLENKTSTKPKKKSEADKVLVWAKKLSKLAKISIEEAVRIACEKLKYKERELEVLNDRNAESPSRMRETLIRKKERENPLRPIKDAEHAENILIAHYRHAETNYDKLLEEGKRLVKEGIIDNAKEYARKNYKKMK